MRTAKSSKIVLLLITMALSLIAFCFCLSGAQSVLAANPNDARDYFSSSDSTASAEFKDDGVSLKVKEEGALVVDSDLALDNLGFEIKANASIKTLNVKVSTLPYVVSGNLKVSGEEKSLVKTIEHVLSITANGSSLSLSFNGETASATLSGDLNVNFNVENNVLTASVEGVELSSNKTEYKVYDVDTCVANEVSFEAAALADGVTETEILILSVDQDVTDVTGKYKQLFKLNDKGEVEKLATPYAVVSSEHYAEDGKIYVKSSYKTTIAMRGLSVLGEIKNANLGLVKIDEDDSDIWLESVINPKSVVFNSVGVKKINIETNKPEYSDKVLRTIEVNAYKEDTVAPTYNTALVDTEIYEAYWLAVKEAACSVNEDGEEVYIELGEDYQVPSLENFVGDNRISYSNLKATVHYKTPTDDEGTNSNFEIPIESAGDYIFYVTFEDLMGNKIEEDDFFTIDEDDVNNKVDGVYGKFVFSFHVEDDADFNVDASKRLGKGYVGELYSATDFIFNASNYTKTYKLFYNSKLDAAAEDDGWVEIIASEELTDSYENEVFSADDIKNIEYNGRLSFTPDRAGRYKITCTIVSDNSTRSDEASAVFTVDKPLVVKPYLPMPTREVLAIVFLSVGGVCLVGIIALIFVKPKEKSDEE